LLQQIKNQEFGKMSNDAENFAKMLEEDAKKRGGFYQIKKEDNRFVSCSYMSKRMKQLVDKFSDVLIIDASHKTNRFNLSFF